jgi:hypothetical protein
MSVECNRIAEMTEPATPPAAVEPNSVTWDSGGSRPTR